MGFLDRLFGREEPRPGTVSTAGGTRSEDEIAVERYRYLLRTAPPETIEQVHEEAFAKLTPDQRQLLFRQLSENAPAGDRPRGDDPHSLAQSATRSELRQPGTLERSLGGGARGIGLGGSFASSMLGSVAGFVIGSALVSAFLPSPLDAQGAFGDTADGTSGDTGAGDPGTGDGAVSADGGSMEAAGWDGGSGWDSGFGGGDFGGGDFGGGDFGGGDFL